MARATLRSLAAELGLSVGTVSRALNNYSDISPATRERVRDAAARAGYDPNPAARRLATGVAEAVAYIMPDGGGAISDTFVAELLKGLGDVLAERGWDLLLVQPGSSPDEPSAVERLVRSGRVGGVVLSRPHRHDARVAALRRAAFPFVVHGRTVDCDDYAWFDVDGHAAFVGAVDHLVALGHQRIGFVGGPTYYNFAQQRLDGYREGLRANGLPDDEALVRIADLSDDGGESAAADLLDGDRPPTALLCVSDTVALGALSALRARGLVAGEDVSVIGYDGLRFARHSAPPLTTMAQPQADAGRRIGEMLLAIVDGAEPRAHQVLRRASMVRRQTDGPAPDTRAAAMVAHESSVEGTTPNQASREKT